MSVGKFETLVNNVRNSMKILNENLDLLNNFLKDYGCNTDDYEMIEEQLRVGDYVNMKL